MIKAQFDRYLHLFVTQPAILDKSPKKSKFVQSFRTSIIVLDKVLFPFKKVSIFSYFSTKTCGTQWRILTYNIIIFMQKKNLNSPPDLEL